MNKFNHPYTEDICIQRLLKEYYKHNGKLFVAFDYDNTIYDYHKNGGDYSEIVNILKECQTLGMVLILFTAQDDTDIIQEHIQYLNSLNIYPTYINEDPVLHTKKPYYNILLDDRAGLNEAYSILKTVIELIKEKKNEDN